jgi:hypothetical protein
MKIGTPTSQVTFEVLDEPAALDAGLRLLARRYLDMGYIDELPCDGRLIDQWTDASTYFGGRNTHGEIVAVSRLIPYTVERGIPTINDFDVDADVRTWLARTRPELIAEFSALAVDPNADGGLEVSRGLYRAMAHHSVTISGRVFWFAALATRVRRLVTRVLDLEMVPIAPECYYRGAVTDPVFIDPVDNIVRWCRTGSALGSFFVDGLEIDLRDSAPGLGESLVDLRRASEGLPAIA